MILLKIQIPCGDNFHEVKFYVVKFTLVNYSIL